MTSVESQSFITSRIPHRPPFLWIDSILELSESGIQAQKYIDAELDLFKGHYPEYPIVPGVILCEAVFQAAAVFISEKLRNESDSSGNSIDGVPVLTRIQGAKFKREVRPGDTIVVGAQLKEQMGPAWFLKGSVRVNGKVAVQVEFACTLKGE